jgi:hypothetical protein
MIRLKNSSLGIKQQSLFHSYCFRWEFDGSEDEAIKSIPYQLQKLFLQLQVSCNNSSK